MRLFFPFYIYISVLMPISTFGSVGKVDCPVVRLPAERLPDMNIPRTAHAAVLANDEVVVIGGHTSGFVLTPTAEYYKDGDWHLIKTVYAHDSGISLVLKSGKVLLAGGFKDNLGIGQSFEVELYDPVTHQSKGFGCLDKKRAFGSALEMDSGRVIIAGNWYSQDGIEIFDGKTSFTHIRNVSQSRCLPHVFRTSDGNALIVASYDAHGTPLDTIFIDRLYGDSYRSELFDNWKPLHFDISQYSDNCFIGDETKGEFRYLMPVVNKVGQLAIVDVCDTVFKPLPTSCPVPMKSHWGPIYYDTPVYADRRHQRAYILGFDNTKRHYVLSIDYSKSPASLTLYHTDPLPEAAMRPIPMLTAEGNLLLTGGKDCEPNSNFSPTASVWLLRFNEDTSSHATSMYWFWGVTTSLLVVAIIVYLVRRRKQHVLSVSEPTPEPLRGDTLLMERICLLMDEQKLYLRQGLKVSDIASALGTNSRYISECVRTLKGCSLTHFVSEYRLEHAKRLLIENPAAKKSTVAIESGFSNDKALARCFKEFTGLTPTQWIESQISKNI